MAITVNDIQTNLNTYLGDTSVDRISAAERLQAITEATVWLQEQLQNDHTVDSYKLNYYDTVHEYKVTNTIADLLQSADLRRTETYQTHTFANKSSRELAEEIGDSFSESSFAVSRKDGDSYLMINHDSRYKAWLLSDFDSLTDGGGTWVVDSTNSDATNLTLDNSEYLYGNGSLNFDISVSQSANNRATIYNSTIDALDMTIYNDTSSFIMEVYIPDVTYISSITLFWGSSSSAYWSNTVTTDINGTAFANGWNRVKFDWNSSTMTSTPDVTSITYFRIDVNYSSSQANDTDFRLDYLRLVKPEQLTFLYTSWSIGHTSTSDLTKIYAFNATTNVPFFSGQYDQYKFAVAHKAASLLYNTPLRLPDISKTEEVEALSQLARVRKIVPKSSNPEVHGFKVNGVSFRRRTQRLRRR